MRASLRGLFLIPDQLGKKEGRQRETPPSLMELGRGSSGGENTQKSHRHTTAPSLFLATSVMRLGR